LQITCKFFYRKTMITRGNEVKASINLDLRRAKKDGRFPVKLYVWDGAAQIGKHYSTGIACSTTEFSDAWEKAKPRKEYQELRKKLDRILRKTDQSIDELETFSFEALDRLITTPKGERQNVFWHYEEIIKNLKTAGRIGTADSYRYAQNALMKYAKSERVMFKLITPKWLQGFEDYMIDADRSMTTIGMYLRTLRYVLNKAIEEGEVKREQYPFGKRKYVIPEGRNTKKALSQEQLKTLFECIPSTPEQEKARDFFFFSYMSNGMNMKDIAQLKSDQMEPDRFHFTRAKTARTKKAKQKPITVFLTETQPKVIATYGNSSSDAIYVFPIISESQSPEEQHRKIKNFTRSVNQHLKKLCRANGLPEISTYWARHSFATRAVNSGASMEFMRESLGHGDMKTTLNYFAGFDDSAGKELAKKLMNF
jgi:integrase/recombinase XerD